MAPARPAFSRIKAQNGKHSLYLFEELQTGAPGTVKLRLSTDKKTWSTWRTALGKRSYDDFTYRSTVQIALSGLTAGTRYYVQAYLFNSSGKSSLLSAQFVA
jgi:hypothetical protein